MDSSTDLGSRFSYPTSLLSLMQSISINYHLIVQMIKREIAIRYRGSIFGVAWVFITPLSMLLVYTFVFSEIFKSRWEPIRNNANTIQFAIIFFVGLIIQGLFSEILNNAPTIIVKNANYVKKVVFPLEILSIVTVGSAIFQSFINLIVLLIIFLMLKGYICWTVIFMPLILFPLVLFSLGIAWIFAAFGVFFRDLAQTTNVISTLLTFLAPVFYPIDAVPEKFRPIIMANPLTFIIEQSRAILLWKSLPDWPNLLIYFLGASAVAWLGYIFFQKTRKGFSDVL